jgi:hypothetical protein
MEDMEQNSTNKLPEIADGEAAFTANNNIVVKEIIPGCFWR